MRAKLRSVLLGKAIKSAESESQKYSTFWGLPILSSDAISSVAYAGEEVLLVLIPVLGAASYKPLLGVAAAIVALLTILVFSYRQTIDCYPQGGGSYSVASDNLGRLPGLVAAASLSIDYVLTVAVSVSAGTAAVTSAVPGLLPFKVYIALLLVALLTLGNLRGLRESSILFGVPTYLFIVSVIVMILTGLVKVLIFHDVPAQTAAMLPRETGGLSVLLLLKAFASGCTALTGVEAVSNGVPNFKNPAQKNAKKVLLLLALLVLTVFVGICTLIALYQVVPGSSETVVSKLAANVFGTGSVMYYVIQATTTLILVMAANTSFSGLPQLLSILARDSYVARSFADRGLRLNYSNGILLLSVLSAGLVVIFQGDTHHLLPLYAVGVFLSFTLSQTGMVLHWRKVRGERWKHKAVINGIGAVTTAVTCVIIAATKFINGAWIVLICIPVLVLLMLAIRKHYDHVRANLAVTQDAGALVLSHSVKAKILLPIQSVNKSFIKALNYALSLDGDLEIYHVSTDASVTEKLLNQYATLGLKEKIVVEEAPYRNVNELLIHHVDAMEKKLGAHEMLTVVLPQFIIPKWWHNILHNQTSIRLRASLLHRRNVVVVSIPYIINE